MIMHLLGSFMIAGMNKIVAGYDIMAIAVAGIFFRLQSFVFMPVFGLVQGFVPLVGYNYGCGEKKRMKQAIFYGIMIATFFTFSSFLLFHFFPALLIRMFNDEVKLLKIGIIALPRVSLGFPIVGAAMIGSTTFQAMGKGMPSLILSFMRQIIILLPAMYFLGKIGGLELLWFAFPLSEIITIIAVFSWLYFTLKKEFHKMK